MGPKLLALRLERGLTQQQLADALLVSRQFISSLERGIIARPSDEFTLDCAKFFGVKVEDLSTSPVVQDIISRIKKAN